tara:strand:- start:6822 stop:8342 length:1521 start_codon:yes stop_codon:yes gene_type:complete
MAGRTLIIPIYYLILIACIGVSSNFSFRGFYETFPTEIYVVVLILALGLFGAGLLLQIGRDRKSTTQQLLALLIFFIFASFSTSSNMNYIYTKMQWEDVRKEAFREEYPKYLRTVREVEKELITQTTIDQDNFEKIATGYYEIIDRKISELKNIISNSQYYVEQKDKHDTLMFQLDQMLGQALDPGAPGCGTKCQEHVVIINSLVPTTEIRITSSKNEEQIKRSWSNYRDLKMKAFCGDESTEYHRLRSLVDAVGATDFCISDSREYVKQYPPNRLEKLRVDIQRLPTYNESELLVYLSKVSEISSSLENTSRAIRPAVAELLSNDTFDQILFPRSVSESIEFLQTIGVEVPFLDPAEILKRAELIRDLNNADFFKGTVSSAYIDQDEVYILDENLTQNDVVKLIEVPLKPFLEVLSAKQKEIVERYKKALGARARDLLLEDNVNTENGQIGEVQHTLNLAFNDFSQTTVISFLLGIAFDLIPIIFAFAAFHGYKPEDPEYDPVIR